MIRKGDRIRWSEVTVPAPAGAQMKVQLVRRAGIVRHVRGNDPVAPTSVRIYVDPDDGAGDVRPPRCECVQAHVELDPETIPIDLEVPLEIR
jgi:hypothetical protein